MRKIIFSSILAISSLLVASNCVAQCEVPMGVLIADEGNIPTAARNHLYNKLHKLIVDYGISEEDGSRFIISSNFTVLDKEILAGPPRSFVYSFDVNLFIGDYHDRKIYTSTTLNVKGVGQNETKAYNDAIKKINLNSPDLKSFIEQGKNKIIEYYNNNYPAIIQNAQSMAKLKNFEEAMYTLMSIPQCSQGYDKAMAVTEKIYQEYVDDLCVRNLNSARMAWGTQQNMSGAQEAAEYLNYIYPDAKCYKEAQGLYNEIHAKVKDDWKFVMKMYDDAVSLEKQRINAWKEVGVAYGKNQKNRTTEIYWVR